MREELMNLQLFADEAAEATETSDSTVETAENDTEGTAASEQPKNQEAKYTDADFDRLINQKFAKWQEQKEKEINEAKRLAEMSAQEKAEYERDALEKKLNELMRKDTLAEMSKSARRIFSDKGLSVNDDLLAMLVTDDADRTKSNVDEFIRLFQSEVRKAVDEAIKGHTPKTGKAPSGMTKEQILSVKNRAERQRLINENMDLFK